MSRLPLPILTPPGQGTRPHTPVLGAQRAWRRLLSKEALRVSKQPLPYRPTAGHHLGTHLPVTSDLQSHVCNRPTGASSWGFFRSRSILQSLVLQREKENKGESKFSHSRNYDHVLINVDCCYVVLIDCCL